jgi:hypothetical protein
LSKKQWRQTYFMFGKFSCMNFRVSSLEKRVRQLRMLMLLRFNQLFLKHSIGNSLNNGYLKLFSNLIFKMLGQFFRECSSRKLLTFRKFLCSLKIVQSSSVMDGFTSSPSILIKCSSGMSIWSTPPMPNSHGNDLLEAIMDKNCCTRVFATNN